MRAAPFLGVVFCSSIAVLGSACGSATPHGTTSALGARTVDDDSYEDVRRLYLVLAPDDPQREEVRQHLIAYLATRSDALLAQGDYDDVVAQLAEMTSLLVPSDLAAGGSVPSALAPVARWVVEHGSPRGDEPRVLASLLLLSRLEPANDQWVRQYEEVARWGREARLGETPQLDERFFDQAPELVQVWEEHARLTPAPDVLDALAGVYVMMRDVVVGSTLERGFQPPSDVGMAELRMAQMLSERIPLDVAAVYLRVGELGSAAEHVGALGDRGGIEWRLRRMIEQASGTDDDAADALGELAGGFERARPDVSIALCRLGVRLHADDARFPLCLARMSAEMDRAAEATAWYARAVELAPDDRDVYDEALGRLAQLMEGGLFQGDGAIGRVRMVARHARSILEQREQRWPNEPPEITTAELDFQLARAEMHAGNVDEAAAYLEDSLRARRSREALVELATLRRRLGDAAGAATLLEEALDHVTQQGPEGSAVRASLLEQLGDARRAAGDAAQARAAYARALELLTPFADQGDETQQALTRVHLGVLQRRLGEVESGDRELRSAIDVAPSWREPYEEILAHLVVSQPDPQLAEEVFRRATTGLDLEAEWRVYFALWVQAIAGRASTPASELVGRTLSEQAQMPGWHGRLAAFAAGRLPEDQLLASAESPGQRCEAHFYAGARKLAAGDTEGARAEFRSAIETRMVGYFEYMMAQELLASLEGPAASSGADATTAAAATR